MAPNNPWRTILPSCFKMELELLQHAKKEEEDPKINHHLLMKKNTLVQQHKQQQISSRMSLSDINIMSFNNSSSADSNSSSCSSSSIFLSTYLAGSNLHVFTLAELKKITQDFSPATFLGEGGFGPVHKGFLLDPHPHHHIMIKHGLKPHQPVAVKLLNLQGTQGHKEWLAEIILLGQLSHPHVVKLIGYCWEDEQRLLIYEYMPGGNLEDQLFSNNNNSSTTTDNRVLVLPWSTRLQIALGVAKALAFLHGQDKPVIYRDFKTSNILLDSDFTAKISDFGLAKDGPQGDETHVTTRVMGTHGYAAPEYVMTGHLTKMSDVYSFGVVLLELMTGRKALDKNRPRKEQSLVEWARPFLKDPVKLEGIMDTRLGLKGPDPDHDGPKLGVAAIKTASLVHQCLSQQAKSRPTMLRVVKALETIINLHNSFNNNNNNNIQPHNVYVDQTKDQKIMIKESHEDYKIRNNINIIIDQEEEEQEQDQGQKKKQCPRRKGFRHKHRLSSLKYSRTVSSEPALYPTLVQNDQSLLLYQQYKHDDSI